MRRSATLLRSSRTQYSILPRSITLSRLATPTISAKARTEAGVYPLRRRAQIVGIRGSSQPMTAPSCTSFSSLRFDIIV